MINAIVFLITRFFEWAHEKDIYYKPYKPTVLGEHNKEDKNG